MCSRTCPMVELVSVGPDSARGADIAGLDVSRQAHVHAQAEATSSTPCKPHRHEGLSCPSDIHPQLALYSWRTMPAVSGQTAALTIELIQDQIGGH
jgi:hypothetical protein